MLHPCMRVNSTRSCKATLISTCKGAKIACYPADKVSLLGTAKGERS
ncbi:hypothetical protein LMG27177_02115 [Paraburkholderia fynbosensis]|uniref:Uncharacterized protein n=1 Tax=Paraburkholderia fynbosensis TaxID=1200993 RepID=A0A6J5FTE6_9BURK|nr:hypothetical protein LMG27177_02115 [Paraburkholderia fynbosensis]